MRDKSLRLSILAGAAIAVAGAAVATARADMMTSVGTGEGEVDIVAWAGYIERGETDKTYDWVTGFEKETGCKVTVKTAGTSDEMVSLMNGGGFDLVTASGDATLAPHRRRARCRRSTPTWSRAASTVDPRLQNAPWHTVDGKHYGVPYQWGPNVLMYNTKVFKERAEELERRVRGDEAARRQVEQGPRPGLLRPDLHRRRRALSEGAQARARHHRSL